MITLTRERIGKLRRDAGDNRGDDRLPLIFNALGDPGRCRIFRLLMKHRETCVTEVATALQMTVSAASQQLKILEMVGLARKERLGQMICYELRDDDPLIKAIVRVFTSLNGP